MFTNGDLAAPLGIGTFPIYGVWFFALAAITLSCLLASLAENLSLTLMLGFLTLGSVVIGIGEIRPFATPTIMTGYLFMLSALAAYYMATSLMMESTFKRVILPLGDLHLFEQEESGVVDDGAGEPGVIRHQHQDIHKPLPTH